MPASGPAPPLDDSAARVEAFIDRFAPGTAACLRASRARLQAWMPRGVELVYDNHNALVLAYAPATRASQVICSLAAYPRWVTLFFLQGASLDDPAGLLQGQGRQVRGIRLQSAADLDRPAVLALLQQARQPWALALDQAAPLRTVIQSVSARQRPRRPDVS